MVINYIAARLAGTDRRVFDSASARVVTEREQATSVGVLFRYERGAFLQSLFCQANRLPWVGGRCRRKLSNGQVVVLGEWRITVPAKYAAVLRLMRA